MENLHKKLQYSLNDDEKYKSKDYSNALLIIIKTFTTQTHTSYMY